MVSAADPVDRSSGRLVELPDAPFLIGELDPATLLAGVVDGPVTVDNDVNWAARAEHAGDDFVYVYLGEGLGCAVVSDGEVTRGRSGLAGEVAHLVTVGPRGRATRLIEVFGDLGLRRPGGTAIDVDRLLAAVTGTGRPAAAVRAAIGDAVAGVVAALVALADPELVVVGGGWGGHPAVIEAISTALGSHPRRVAVRAAQVPGDPSHAGARLAALTHLRAAIVDAPR